MAKNKTARDMTVSEMAEWIASAPTGRRSTYSNRSGAVSDELCRRVCDGEITREEYNDACNEIMAAKVKAGWMKV